MADPLPPSTPNESSPEPGAAPPPLPLEPLPPKKVPPPERASRLRRLRGRLLRRDRALGAILIVSAVVAVAFYRVTTFSERSKDTAPAPSAVPPGQVPDVVRNAPTSPPPPSSRPAQAPAPARSPVDEEAQRRREEEQQADRRAQNASALFDTPGRPDVGGERERVPEGASRARDPFVPTPSAGAGSASGADLEADPNFQSRKNAFVEGERHTKEVLTGRVREPRSPFEVKAGSIIPAVLLTGINSDLPGPVIGQVRESVYDTVTGNQLLIPQGAKLLATYDSLVAWGQERVLVCWTRLVFPNGASLDLECMPAADLQGAAGFTDEVDEHWGRILKGVAISSLLSATAQGVVGSTQGYNPTVPQLWARGAAGDVNNAGQQITRRNIQIQPTITVRPGFSVNVVVTRDMVLPPYRDLGMLSAAMP